MFGGVRRDVLWDEVGVIGGGSGPMGLISNVKCNQRVSELESDVVRFAFQKDHSIIWQGDKTGGRETSWELVQSRR